jgi:hypothetical protein
VAEQEELTKLEDELLTLLRKNNIDDNLIDVCFTAFLTDEAKEQAIKWLKENQNFTDANLHDVILKFGIESENFSLTTEIIDDDTQDE